MTSSKNLIAFALLSTAAVPMEVSSTCRAANGDGTQTSQVSQSKVVRDLLWIWGNPEMASPGKHSLATYAQAGPAERARLLGVPNIVMTGFGLPKDDDVADRLMRSVTDSNRLVWQITTDGELGVTPFVYQHNISQVNRLAEENRQIEAILLNDLSTIGLRHGFKSKHIHGIRQLLKGPGREVKIWGRVYVSSLAFLLDGASDYGLGDIIKQLDAVVLATWDAKDVVDLEANLAHLERLYAKKRIVISLDLYDYGGQRRMPQELLELQCETALRLAHAGRIDGIVFTPVINDPQAMTWTTQWIKRVGDQKLGSPEVGAREKGATSGSDTPRVKRSPESNSNLEPLTINKLYFMYHPVCWSMGMNGNEPPAHAYEPALPGVSKQDYMNTLQREVLTVRRQQQLMSRLKFDEALILFPISESKTMQDLEQYATRALGRRCIIVRGVHGSPPAAWAELSNPLERFLNDDNLEGKAEYLKGVPPQIRAELETEIRQACQMRGCDWPIVSAFDVIFTSRMWALQIEKEFRKRGLSYDPAIVKSVAYGEGFEQCATTWKAMLIPYLGLALPAEGDYRLSVSGARFLTQGEFKEQIKLGRDIRLFLWTDPRGRPVGLYMRSRCQLKDPQFYAHVPLEGMSLEIWSVSSYGTKLWPTEDSRLDKWVQDRHMKVPVYNGIRKGGDDGSYYLIGNGISFDDFRVRLVQALISE